VRLDLTKHNRNTDGEEAAGGFAKWGAVTVAQGGVPIGPSAVSEVGLLLSGFPIVVRIPGSSKPLKFSLLLSSGFANCEPYSLPEQWEGIVAASLTSVFLQVVKS
jgi:hypothetical protein